MSSDIQFCQHCDASISSDASFCGNCGMETQKRRREYRQAARETNRELKSASRAIAWIFVGSLLAMVLTAVLIESEAIGYLTFCAIDLAICGIALHTLGPNSARFSLGRVPDGTGVALGLLLPVVSVPIAWGYASLFSDGTPVRLPYSLPAMLVLFAVMPALVEEWMFRGVLWIALRPLTSRAIAICVTAALFGAVHGLNGGFVLEMPHRFVMGLLLGWLRAHTASIWPCVLAHFLHNAIAISFLE